jgi:hypothetical protein
MEATLVLALPTQRCELYLMPSHQVETKAMATLRPRHGMWIMAHPRRARVAARLPRCSPFVVAYYIG